MEDIFDDTLGKKGFYIRLEGFTRTLFVSFEILKKERGKSSCQI